MKTREHFGISVVIRTKDSEKGIHNLLKTLSLQTVKSSQLVVVDNYSNEEKLEEMKAFLDETKKMLFQTHIPITLVPLPDRDFSHPYSTNLGVFYAENEFVCITNGHSLPISQNWLENGLIHFKDPSVVGVSGYFHPSSNASVWERFHSFVWATSKEATNTSRIDHHFSTINGLLRKSCWREYPFDENLPKIVAESERYGGEDYDWGLEMIARGYKIIVEPKFDVYHSHHEGFSPFLSRRIAYRMLRSNIKRLSRPRESFTNVFNFKNRVYEL
jgi:glycosyltransferase involved in cell wall biosynthesis